MAAHHYIACDLGAGSGRVMLGTLRDGKATLEEIHRFASEPVQVLGTTRWDVLGIFRDLKTGLKKLAERYLENASLSVDSWGVDYVLFDATNPQLQPPFHYRDARTDATFQAALDRATPARIFAETGIQFMAINTLYQLLAESPELLARAGQFLTIGNYFNYLFSGVAWEEISNASTTQLFNPRRREWSRELIGVFELPEKIFPPLAESGTVLGPLLPAIAAETHLPRATKIIAACSHDTGAAVAAVPAQGEDWAYLSSGTWSLIGVELPAPLINDEVRERNYTNEAGYGGTTRFLKNIIGMWILQECLRAWPGARVPDFAEIDRLARAATPLRSLIHPNAARFWKPGDMAGKIRGYCIENGQPAPEEDGQLFRCIFESLALLYLFALEEIRALTGREIHRLHIVGGGSQNRFLNQLAADATGCTVIAGPVEATAIGNVLIQAIALGHLASLAALRETVRDSFAVETFSPQAGPAWREAHERFSSLALS